MEERYSRNSEAVILLIFGLVLLAVSGLAPFDRTTWVLEIFPIVLATPVLVLSASRFPLTRLAYRLIFLHAIVLMVGGHYSYARVPLGFWLADLLHFTRNNYDRLGHVMQGFAPAIIVREILLRRSPLSPGKWLTFIVIAICLAISAVYELVEWAVAGIEGQAANDFLGTQGDSWDTQWDMLCALLGATASVTLLRALHDRHLANLTLPVCRT